MGRRPGRLRGEGWVGCRGEGWVGFRGEGGWGLEYMEVGGGWGGKG